MSVNSKSAAIPERNRVNLLWLIKLRWGSVAGQLATIFWVLSLVDIHLPLIPLLLIVAVEAASNVVASLWLSRTKAEVREYQLAGIMGLDVVLLTLLLYFTGGPENPFTFLYLVYIALAAVALHAQWTWMLVALALMGVGILPLAGYRELPLSHLMPGEREAIVQKGMWVAFGVTAGFIVHFLWRVTGALAERDSELWAARQVTERQEQLASLATVAAGAAHELATPLGTIALVAKELERNIPKPGSMESSLEDVCLIREQVARCRLILDQMGAGLGRSSEQVVEDTSLPALIRDALTGVRAEPAVFVEVDDVSRGSVLRLPGRAVSQALRALITNAQDANCELRVLVKGRIAGGRVHISVIDKGPGMSSDVLSRISEPFFTTKPPGSGMGLGLYLTRAVVESLGGSLQIGSEPGEGTMASVELPITVDLQRIGQYAASESHV
ncbi:MAG: HAMP domain-containing histidine kinase [Myxococcales bacterium]|nr:HAMP domain-containing histidine kinase [Myxococcales bacterium]